MGFTATVADKEKKSDLAHGSEQALWRKRFIISMIIVVPVIALMLAPKGTLMGEVVKGLSAHNLILFLASTAAMALVGRTFVVSGYKALRHGAANMDTLIGLGTGGAYVFSVIAMLTELGTDAGAKQSLSGGWDSEVIISLPPLTITPPPPRLPSTQVFFYETGPMLFAFVSLGRLLEHKAKGKTSEALSKLMSIQASEAVLVELNADNTVQSEQTVSIDLLQRDDLVKVVPGARIPADGIVVLGSSHVDESLISGEPIPVLKQIGDQGLGVELPINSFFFPKSPTPHPQYYSDWWHHQPERSHPRARDACWRAEQPGADCAAD